jgi:acetyl esterase/lipase
MGVFEFSGVSMIKITKQKQGTLRYRLNTFLLSNLSPAMRVGLLTCLFLAFVFGGVGFFLIFRFYGFFPAFVSYLIFLIGAVAVATIVTLIFVALKRMRWQTFFVIFVSTLLSIATLALLLYLVPLMVFCTISIYLAVMFATGKYKSSGKLKKILHCGLLGLTGIAVVFLLIVIFSPGSTEDRPDRAMLSLPYADNIQSVSFPILENPSLPGNYSHRMYFYAAPGQRTDPYPTQYTLSARSVDASALLDGWSGIRRWHLGFEPDSLPLNAQVWMPEGEGSFPLVLIVHGNHTAGNRSDVGYAYLGEHLASRGIIVASIDQNFLNSSPFYDALVFAGLENEFSTRAFVALEHLREWYKWNTEPSHPFYGKVDFDRIALIGHSRGGESAALAAAFADMSHYPGNGSVELDYPFRINTVIAIAPSHGMYRPAGLEMSLRDINYLVLQGGHDKDVQSFMGANMFSRIDVSEYGTKASVWMSHANHGQFNTAWGRSDLPGLWRMVTNRRLLMPIEEQQQAAKVFISAFLEITLHGREEYSTLFRDFAFGADWLPPALYVTAFANSSTLLLDSFDGGFDFSVSTSRLVTYTAQGFDRWVQTELPGKWDNTNRVLMLQWGNENFAQNQEPPVFRMDFAEGTWSVSDRLFLSMSSGNTNNNDSNISFQIRLTDIDGRTSTKHINDFGGVANPIEARIFTPFLSVIMGDTSEPVLQMISISADRFDGLNGEITRMEWIMDNIGTEQVLLIDDLLIGGYD